VIDDVTNSNINMYIGCETSGGAWSSASSGTNLRYNLVDSAQTWAMFDFPLHDAGDFDVITNLWIQVVLVVSGTRLLTYDDGMPVSDSVYGFYTGGGVTYAANVAYPHPGTLTGEFGAFGMVGNIHLGARADHNADRHFLGDMAGVMVSQEDLTPEQVSCIFTASEEFLPAQLVECVEQPVGQLSVSFLGNTMDMSGNRHSVTLGGPQDAVTFNGIRFDGDDDFALVEDFDYETGDGTFSVSFWMTKEDCTGGIYEYLYSHMTSTGGDMWSTSSINLYLGCEVAGGGFSTTTGTIMRYNIVDTAAQNPMFDFPLHDAGDFDAVTNLWVHFVLGVTKTGMKTWDDGMPVPDGGCTEASVGSAACPYHFYNDAATMAADPAYPKPSQLNPVAPGYDFGDDSIHLGARADHDPNRHFRGKMALVNVYDYAVSDVQAECMFRGGDAALPDPSAIYSSSGCAPLEVDISFIGDTSDRSGNGHVVTLQGGASVSMDGLHVDGQGQWAEIPNFDYADDCHFSIEFWMTT
jgi:hypothetical protein